MGILNLRTFFGLGGSIHDFTVAAITDEQAIYTCEVERLIRRRYALEYEYAHEPAVDYLISELQLKRDEIVICADDMILERDNLAIEFRCNHHDAHAAGAFFRSHFDSCDIVVVDGVGSSIDASQPERRETVSLYHVSNGIFSLIKRLYGEPSNIRINTGTPRIRTNSLGDWYRLFTQCLGFDYLQAGKLMGLVPYGNAENVVDLDSSISFSDTGLLEISYDTPAIQKLLAESDGISLLKGNHLRAADLAAFAQAKLEEMLSHILKHLQTDTKADNLILVGGVVQNALAMGKFPLGTDYERVFVDIAPGDNGVALGAAFLGQREFVSNPKPQKFIHTPFTQICRSTDKIQTALNRGFKVQAVDTDAMARELAAGKIVATHFGFAEFGARALGHRSIIADARSPKMRDQLNDIKGREWFRPIAPCILDEVSTKYFDTELDCQFMQYVVQTHEHTRELVPSAVHVDGTARVQFVRSGDEPLWTILQAFEKVTGVPILLNTSFNIAGKPIAHEFSDALDDFVLGDIDYLYFEGGVISAIN